MRFWGKGRTPAGEEEMVVPTVSDCVETIFMAAVVHWAIRRAETLFFFGEASMHIDLSCRKQMECGAKKRHPDEAPEEEKIFVTTAFDCIETIAITSLYRALRRIDLIVVAFLNVDLLPVRFRELDTSTIVF